MTMNNSPYFLQPASVRSVMLRVLLALIPGIAVYVGSFGVGILVQLALASVTALVAEAVALSVRGRPLGLYLTDGSALVTAWLIALTFPPIVPWWITVVACALAIVVVKHLYGGLGQNPFNPAMAVFCLMIVAYPQLMAQWPPLHLGAAEQLHAIFGSARVVDAITSATPLDALRTGLHGAGATVSSVVGALPVFGSMAGQGWEWVAAAYLLGGLWLVQQRIITWHIPLAFLLTLTVLSGVFSLIFPARFAGPLFHLMSGGAMLGAFFIATDPVSAASTPRGKLYYAGGIAALTWVIRNFGAFPDGVAFGTLLMNIAAPLIDSYTQPPVFGHKKKK